MDAYILAFPRFSSTVAYLAAPPSAERAKCVSYTGVIRGMRVPTLHTYNTRRPRDDDPCADRHRPRRLRQAGERARLRVQVT